MAPIIAVIWKEPYDPETPGATIGCSAHPRFKKAESTDTQTGRVFVMDVPKGVSTPAASERWATDVLRHMATFKITGKIVREEDVPAHAAPAPLVHGVDPRENDYTLLPAQPAVLPETIAQTPRPAVAAVTPKKGPRAAPPTPAGASELPEFGVRVRTHSVRLEVMDGVSISLNGVLFQIDWIDLMVDYSPTIYRVTVREVNVDGSYKANPVYMELMYWKYWLADNKQRFSTERTCEFKRRWVIKTDASDNIYDWPVIKDEAMQQWLTYLCERFTARSVESFYDREM